MIRARLLLLAERRARLSARAGAERESIAGFVAQSDGAFRMAAGVLAAIRGLLGELRERPLFTGIGIALLIALRPRRAFGWALKGWSLWRAVRGVQRWWRLDAAPLRTTSSR